MDELSGLRSTPHRLDNARQNARRSGRRGDLWHGFILEDLGSLSRRRHDVKQAPWRKVVTLALGAGFLDLNRKGGLLTLHLDNDFGLETTLIWGLGR